MATTQTMIMASLPFEADSGTEEEHLAKLQQQLGKIGATICKVKLPNVPTAPSDTLMGITAEITTVLLTVEDLRNKVRANTNRSNLPSNSDPAKTAIFNAEQFEWDVILYPIRLAADMKKVVLKARAIAEENLKTLQLKHGSVASLRSNVHTLVEGTRCMARGDLRLIVNPKDVVSSEHCVTILVLVPLAKEGAFLKSYGDFHEHVDDTSAKSMGKDEHHSLYRVVLFRHAVPTFITKAVKLGCADELGLRFGFSGCQIREFTASPAEHESARDELRGLVQKKAAEEKDLRDWCQAKEDSVETLRYHLMTLRLAADCKIKHGRSSFLPVVVCTPPACVQKVRTILEEFVGKLGAPTMDDDDDELYRSLMTEDEADNVPYLSYHFKI